MAGMRRQKQYDMFDVATGNCDLDDYLNQRYSENDLSSKFWIEKDDQVDELRAPKPTEHGTPGTEPVVIPIQGPNAPKPKPSDEAKGEAALAPPVGLEPDSPSLSKTEGETVLSDGKDTLQPQKVEGAPAMETYSEAKSSPELSSQESVEISGETSEDPKGKDETTPPSMQDLLAKFHQATQEYQDRSAESPSEDS